MAREIFYSWFNHCEAVFSLWTWWGERLLTFAHDANVCFSFDKNPFGRVIKMQLHQRLNQWRVEIKKTSWFSDCTFEHHRFLVAVRVSLTGEVPIISLSGPTGTHFRLGAQCLTEFTGGNPINLTSKEHWWRCTEQGYVIKEEKNIYCIG